MTPNPLSNNYVLHSKRTRVSTFVCLAVLLALLLPSIAFGQDATDTINTTCTFAGNINKILNAVSIIVVTIAVVFSGYQIAFAHKRIAEVAPVLIGGILIGAASQIATMFLKTSAGSSACSTTTSLMTYLLNNYA